MVLLQQLLKLSPVKTLIGLAKPPDQLSLLRRCHADCVNADLPWLGNVVRAKQPKRLPVVLTRSEVRDVLVRITGVYGLMANMLYGTRMRLVECVRLRVKDVDFERGEILIREGKGGKDRVTILPASVVSGLRTQLDQRRTLFDDDKRIGKADVFLPDALEKKYPNAATKWCWQYIFPSGSFSVDPRSGVERRHHVDEKLL